MATHDTLDIATFRLLYPAFSNDVLFPDALLNAYYANATMYISDNDSYCGGLSGARLDLALMLLTAHLLFGFNNINKGTLGGIITSATIDKVAVALQPPPATTSWRYWLSTSPYGLQLLALLTAASIGGWSVGGLPERRAFRKVGGTFR
jgi:hypothetical protein